MQLAYSVLNIFIKEKISITLIEDSKADFLPKGALQ